MFNWQSDLDGTFTILSPQARITLTGDAAAKAHQLLKAWINLCYPLDDPILTNGDYIAGREIILSRLWNTYKGVE